MQKNYPFPLNSLRHFYWAAKLGSFKKAAEEIHISEAAVSQQIRNLEDSLGTQLFERQQSISRI
jgi:LysR family transcriptional regulator, glycine cleavage system transcriptional activator